MGVARASALSLFVVLAACESTVQQPPPPIANDSGIQAPIADASSPDTSPPPTRPTVRATLRTNPINVVSAFVDVDVTFAREVVVESGDRAGVYGDRTPPRPVPASGHLTVPIFGLLPATQNHVRVIARGDGGEASTDDLVVTMDAIPLSTPFEVHVVTPLGGYILVSLIDTDRKLGRYYMLDRGGRVVWYWTQPPPWDPQLGSDFRRFRGNFLLFDPSVDAFLELDLGGGLVHTWRDTATAAVGMDAHDAFPLANGHLLLGGWDEPHTVDTTKVWAGGAVDAQRRDQTVDEIDESGHVIFHWSSYPEITLDELVVRPTAYDPFDPTDFQATHTNAWGPTPDGNILVSHRSLSSLTKLDRATGKIAWRLGGKKSDFKIVGDAFGGFDRQHDARFIGDHRVMMIDNGNYHKPPETRVVQYDLDEAAMTATLVYEYRHDPPAFSPFGGSARYLDDGHLLVSYGQLGMITELDEAKNVLWELRAPGIGLYRAVYVPTLYP